MAQLAGFITEQAHRRLSGIISRCAFAEGWQGILSITILWHTPCLHPVRVRLINYGMAPAPSKVKRHRNNPKVASPILTPCDMITPESERHRRL